MIGKDALLITITNDLDSFQAEIHEKIVDESTEILFICHAGMRSEMAAILVEKMGYKNTYNIIGGFAQWVNSGLAYKKMRQS
ncbi:MAG UNVERIFIED_CONTAM: rhodanese-like domain-containing protein [Rickettsiaceae bacterium]|jgi:rhodanese-related sulfurtransferase